jgi:hypothetical protein
MKKEDLTSDHKFAILCNSHEEALKVLTIFEKDELYWVEGQKATEYIPKDYPRHIKYGENFSCATYNPDGYIHIKAKEFLELKTSIEEEMFKESKEKKKINPLNW